MDSIEESDKAVCQDSHETTEDPVCPAHKVCDFVIDWSDLAERVCDETLITKVVGLFVDSYSQQLEQLSQAIKTRHSEMVQSMAHALKGAAASIGAQPISQAAYRLELAAKQGEWSVLAGEYDQLRFEFEKLVSFVSQDNWIAAAKRQV